MIDLVLLVRECRAPDGGGVRWRGGAGAALGSPGSSPGSPSATRARGPTFLLFFKIIEEELKVLY